MPDGTGSKVNIEDTMNKILTLVGTSITVISTIVGMIYNSALALIIACFGGLFVIFGLVFDESKTKKARNKH